jgi:hypothetical protein
MATVTFAEIVIGIPAWFAFKGFGMVPLGIIQLPFLLAYNVGTVPDTLCLDNCPVHNDLLNA